MGVQISAQLLLFAQSILLGLAAGALYGVLRPLRRQWPPLAPALDLLYALALAAAGSAFLLRPADGVLRGYAVLGAAGGAALWYCGCDNLLRPLWAFWAETVDTLVSLALLPVTLTVRLCRWLGRTGGSLLYFAQKRRALRFGRRRPARSGSPGRGQGRSSSSDRGQGRSNSPGRGQRQGRSGSPGRGQGQRRSANPSRVQGQGQSNSPGRGQGQGRSNSPGRGQRQGRSGSPGRGQGQRRSANPSRVQGQSNSPGRGQGQGRSSSPGRTGGQEPGTADRHHRQLANTQRRRRRT